jgi:hypothetical protein
MPKTFTFNKIPRTSLNQPESLTFHNEDNIVEKSLKPIEIGALLPGILFVVFQNVDQAVFRTGVTYTVTFEDVLSREYSATIKSSGQSSEMGLVPGLKTEMSCPIPPGGLPKIGSDLLKPN